MYTFFVILIVVASLLMIGIVLIQESKGVEKATWGLAAFMVVISIVCAYTAPQSTADQSVLEKAATESQATNPTNTQGFQAGQQAPAQGAAKGTTAPAQGAQNAPATPAAPAK